MVRRLVIAAAIVLSGCAAALVAQPGGSAEQPLAVIDAHVQTNFSGRLFEQAQIMDSKSELAAEMKRYHVVGAVSMNHPEGAYADLSDLNIVQCVGLPEKVNAEKLEADLASREYGCLTIYLGYQRQDASDPNYAPAYRIAEKYHVPVVFQYQTGDLEDRYASPFGADKVAPSHPKVTFVLAHDGNPRTADQRDRDAYLRRKAHPAVVSGLGDDPWIGPASSVASKNPNVVLDGSGFLTGDLLADSPEQITSYLLGRVRWVFDRVADRRKLMFGTGWPRTAIGPYLELFKRAIPKRYWHAVFHDNAARVYGFSRRPFARPHRSPNIPAVEPPMLPSVATTAPVPVRDR
jgi:predicted TIM-barrel fold metal-dependent hydrolase